MKRRKKEKKAGKYQNVEKSKRAKQWEVFVFSFFFRNKPHIQLVFNYLLLTNGLQLRIHTEIYFKLWEMCVFFFSTHPTTL